MDINFEESINGIQCYELIKKEQDIKVVYLTAYTDDKIIDKAIKINPLAYLIKPFNNDELKAVLKLISYKLFNNYQEYKNKENIIKIDKDYYYNKQKNILFFK